MRLHPLAAAALFAVLAAFGPATATAHNGAHSLLGFAGFSPKLSAFGIDYIGLDYGQTQPTYTAANAANYPETHDTFRLYAGFGLNDFLSLELGYEAAEEETRTTRQTFGAATAQTDQLLGFEAFYLDAVARTPIGKTIHPATRQPLWHAFGGVGVGRYFIARATRVSGLTQSYTEAQDNETAFRLSAGLERTLSPQWSFRAQALYTDLTLGSLGEKATVLTVGLNFSPKPKVEARDI